jgi:hypothetical protein
MRASADATHMAVQVRQHPTGDVNGDVAHLRLPEEVLEQEGMVPVAFARVEQIHAAERDGMWAHSRHDACKRLRCM